MARLLEGLDRPLKVEALPSGASTTSTSSVSLPLSYGGATTYRFDGYTFTDPAQLNAYIEAKRRGKGMVPSNFFSGSAQSGGDIAAALRPYASAVQAAVNSAVGGIKDLSALVSASKPVNGSRTLNDNRTITFTVNAAPGQSPEDIGRIVEDKFMQINRDSEIYGDCP